VLAKGNGRGNLQGESRTGNPHSPQEVVESTTLVTERLFISEPSLSRVRTEEAAFKTIRRRVLLLCPTSAIIHCVLPAWMAALRRSVLSQPIDWRNSYKWLFSRKQHLRADYKTKYARISLAFESWH